MLVLFTFLERKTVPNVVRFAGLTLVELGLAKSHNRTIMALGLEGAPDNDNFRRIICSEDDLRSRIFGSFSDKFLACLPLLRFSNFKKIV